MPSRHQLSALSYRQDDNVAVWHITDFDKLFQEEMEEGEKLYAEKSGTDEITATVVQFNNAPNIGREKQEHINEIWSELAQTVDIERAAYVGDGISAMAVKSNVTAPGVEIDDFNDVEDAVEWAKNAQ